MVAWKSQDLNARESLGGLLVLVLGALVVLLSRALLGRFKRLMSRVTALAEAVVLLFVVLVLLQALVDAARHRRSRSAREP